MLEKAERQAQQNPKYCLLGGSFHDAFFCITLQKNVPLSIRFFRMTLSCSFGSRSNHFQPPTSGAPRALTFHVHFQLLATSSLPAVFTLHLTGIQQEYSYTIPLQSTPSISAWNPPTRLFTDYFAFYPSLPPPLFRPSTHFNPALVQGVTSGLCDFHV